MDDSWKGMRSKDRTDEEAEDDVSIQNEQSWVIRQMGTIAPRHFDRFEIERGEGGDGYCLRASRLEGARE